VATKMQQQLALMKMATINQWHHPTITNKSSNHKWWQWQQQKTTFGSDKSTAINQQLSPVVVRIKVAGNHTTVTAKAL